MPNVSQIRLVSALDNAERSATSAASSPESDQGDGAVLDPRGVA